MENKLSKETLRKILKDFLDIDCWEGFYIKSKDKYEIDSSIENSLDWIEVCVDDFGNVRFNPTYSKNNKITNDFFFNHDGEVVCCMNNEDDDFFWRVTLGNLLAGEFFIRKKPDIMSVKATIHFLKSQDITEIIINKHHQNEEKIYYSLLDSHKNIISNNITEFENCFLYKAILDVLQYYDIELEEHEQKTSFILKENFDF